MRIPISARRGDQACIEPRCKVLRTQGGAQGGNPQGFDRRVQQAAAVEEEKREPKEREIREENKTQSKHKTKKQKKHNKNTTKTKQRPEFRVPPIQHLRSLYSCPLASLTYTTPHTRIIHYLSPRGHTVRQARGAYT